MKNRRRLLIRLLAVALLIGLALLMLPLGRGHTLYFDNKTLEVEGKTYPAYFRAQVFSNQKEIAKLAKRERGMQTWIGQRYEMRVDTRDEKGGAVTSHQIKLRLPYHMDGIVLNLPALLAGEPESVYLSAFVPLIQESAEDEEVVTDEFDITVIEGN